MKKLELAGQTFGRLFVKEFAGNNKRGRPTWVCVCSCDTTVIVTTAHLRNGHATSCGCYRSYNTIKRNTTHGFYHTPTYISWAQMKYRICNKNCPDYKYYGGRGIKLCARWNTFENFLEDMGERLPGTSIDRINNEGNYEPGNCRWATQKEQINNRRCSKRNKIKGELV